MWPGTTSSPTPHVVSHPSLAKQQVLFIVEGFNTDPWLHVSPVSLGLNSERQKLKKIWWINSSDTERYFPLAWDGFTSPLHSNNATEILHETVYLLLHPPLVWRQKSRLRKRFWMGSRAGADLSQLPAPSWPPQSLTFHPWRFYHLPLLSPFSSIGGSPSLSNTHVGVWQFN